MEETRKLAEFIHNTKLSDLPSSVVERVKVYTLDCLACGYVGSAQPWSKIVAETVKAWEGKGETSIFTLPWQAPAPHAALVNGSMIGAFESEHIGHVSHPAGTVFPATFAIAEREKSSGKDYTLALAIGYEVVCRIGEAQTGTVEHDRGFHNPAANGPFSAAAATGKLLGFDLETTINALGVAGSHCGGLTEYAWKGEMTKRLHLGRASQLGLESALLAQRGFTGPATIIEGRYGYLNAFSPTPKPEKLLDKIGQEWLMETLIIKAYPVHATGQAVVSTIQKLKRERQIDPAKIEKVDIRGSGHMMQKRFMDPAPTNMMGAQLSLFYTTASAFHRDFDDPLTYDEATLSDPSIQRLARNVTLTQQDPAKGDAITVDITVGGETIALTAAPFRGSIGNPADFDDVTDKFRRYSRHAIDERRQSKIVDMVRGLDDLADVGEIARAVRG